MGMTQEELAQRMGYKSRSTIAKIEAGENDITQSKIAKFASILNTTPACLMGWEEAKNKPTELTPKEEKHIEKYRRLSTKGQIAADNMIDSLLSIEQNSNEE